MPKLPLNCKSHVTQFNGRKVATGIVPVVELLILSLSEENYYKIFSSFFFSQRDVFCAVRD